MSEPFPESMFTQLTVRFVVGIEHGVHETEPLPLKAPSSDTHRPPTEEAVR